MRRASYLWIANELGRTKLPKARHKTIEQADKIREKRLLHRIRHSEWRADNLTKVMLASAKSRARAEGLTFDLTEEWARNRTEYCELSGMPMIRSSRIPGSAISQY